MISIITCSVRPPLLQKLKASIAATIGVEHEVLAWDNREKKIGLAAVYNKMAADAVYPYVCFVHEDVEFLTPGWGNMLLEILQNQPGAGLVGVAGSQYKSACLSGWYSGGQGFDYYSITHVFKGEQLLLREPGQWPSSEIPVVTLDGVFLFCSREDWQQVRFNEDLLDGFHFYDIDFSLRMAHKKRVIVTNRIQLLHYTEGGDFGNNWMQLAIRFHDASKGLMPYSVEGLTTVPDDIPVIKYWLDWLKAQNMSFANRVKWVSIQNLWGRPLLWYSITKFLFYRSSGLIYLHRWIKNKKHDG
jgi:hypothetical protein